MSPSERPKKRPTPLQPWRLISIGISLALHGAAVWAVLAFTYHPEAASTLELQPIELVILSAESSPASGLPPVASTTPRSDPEPDPAQQLPEQVTASDQAATDDQNTTVRPTERQAADDQPPPADKLPLELQAVRDQQAISNEVAASGQPKLPDQLPPPDDQPAAPERPPSPNDQPPPAQQVTPVVQAAPQHPSPAVQQPLPDPKPQPPKQSVARPPKPQPSRSARPDEHALITTKPSPANALPAATSAAPAQSASSGTPDPAWLAQVGAWLLAHRSYPEMARALGRQGTVVMQIIVDQSGHVEEVNLLHGSGSDSLDQAAEALVRNAHLPPFPSGMTLPRQSVTVPIHYRLE